jgi:hypothetical protein
VAVERYKIWDISYHAGTALWLWRGTRYGTSPIMQGLPPEMHLENLWLANKKGIDVAQHWAKNL